MYVRGRFEAGAKTRMARSAGPRAILVIVAAIGRSVERLYLDQLIGFADAAQFKE